MLAGSIFQPAGRSFGSSYTSVATSRPFESIITVEKEEIQQIAAKILF